MRVAPTLVAVVFLLAAGLVAYVIANYARSAPLLCWSVQSACFFLPILQSTTAPTSRRRCRWSTMRCSSAIRKIRPLAFLKSRLAQVHSADRRDRVELVGIGFSWPNLSMSHGFDHTLGYNPLRLELATKAFGAGDTIAGWDQRRFPPLLASYDSVMARLLGLRYIVTPVPLTRIDRKIGPGRFPLIHRTKRAFIYENPSALPRVMFVPQWQEADFDALLKSGKWPKVDPRRTVLLAHPPDPGGAMATATPPAPAKAEPRISIVRYRNAEVEIAVEAPTSGFVVLNDIWHPWWIATIDGALTPIYKANVMFRAVSVSAGQHRVRFTFKPFQGALREILGTWP